MIKYIDDNVELEGKRVLLRLDLNVPIEDGVVMDPYRLERAIETVDFLRAKKAQTIIIAHCEGKDSTTLAPMWHYLNGYFPVEFCPTFFTPESVSKLLELKDGGVLLFENVRNNTGEKENDPEFAKKLSQMADMYVNDAFSVSHRKHASIVGVTEFLPHYAGLLMRQEIEHLSKAFDPLRPFLFILGGAKFDTKLPIIQKYLVSADNVFVGGALANNFLKEKGLEIGTSLVDEGEFEIKEMLQKNGDNNSGKLLLPIDVTVQDAAETISFKKVTEVLPTDYIGDVGSKTLEMLKPYIVAAKTIVWNGPLGNYEKGFTDKTEQLAEMISQSNATTIVGGGDTLASIKKLGIDDKFTFISTGGGAMLDFLVDETLVGIDALNK